MGREMEQQMGVCCRGVRTSSVDFIPPTFALEEKRDCWAVAVWGINELFLRMTET